MLRDNETALPLWPSHGNRRKLDELWLRKLESDGGRSFLPDCPGRVPKELHAAVEQFNAGLFWECHETLEDVWRRTPYPLRFFYHAIIKLAVGLYHASRHNQRGSRKKLFDGVRVLGLFQPHYLGLQTDALLKEASARLGMLEGPVDWAELDNLPPPIIRTADLPRSSSDRITGPPAP